MSTSKEKSSDAAGLRQTKTIMDVYYMRPLACGCPNMKSHIKCRVLITVVFNEA